MDKVFSIPPKAEGRWAIWGLMAAFVLANAGLSAVLYGLVKHAQVLPSWKPWQLGFVIGAGYLGLVRSKFATFDGQPFGFEYLYDLGKGFAYIRVNRRVTAARAAAVQKKATENLADLVAEARLAVSSDSLLEERPRKEAKEWILRVLRDKKTTDDEKKLALADLILFGNRAGHD
jgi:hypothetical protein